MRRVSCELSFAQEIPVAVRYGNLTHFNLSPFVAVAIHQLARTLLDLLDEFVHEIHVGRRVHPAGMLIEPLVHEELSPGHSAIGIQAFITDHVHLGTKIKRGMRIDQQHRVPGTRQLSGQGDTVRPGRLRHLYRQ